MTAATPATADSGAATLAPSRARRLAVRTVAVLYAAGTAVASFGLPSLLTAWTTSGAELELRTHYLLWGLLAGLFIPLAALPLVRRARAAQGQQLLALVAGVVVALLLAFEPENARYLALFGVPALVLVGLHPERRRLLTVGSFDRVMAGLCAVAVVPAAAYAFVNLRLSAQTHYLEDLHGGYAHAGVLAVAAVLTAAVAARRASGWLWAAATVVVIGTCVGVAGLLFPEDPSSLGRLGGTATLAWAAAFAAASARQLRR